MMDLELQPGVQMKWRQLAFPVIGHSVVQLKRGAVFASTGIVRGQVIELLALESTDSETPPESVRLWPQCIRDGLLTPPAVAGTLEPVASVDLGANSVVVVWAEKEVVVERGSGRRAA